MRHRGHAVIRPCDYSAIDRYFIAFDGVDCSITLSVATFADSYTELKSRKRNVNAGAWGMLRFLLRLLFSLYVMDITFVICKTHASPGMDDSSYRLNFDLGKKNEIHHYS